MDRLSDHLALITRGRHAKFEEAWSDIRTWGCGGNAALAIARIKPYATKHRDEGLGSSNPARSARQARIYGAISRPEKSPSRLFRWRRRKPRAPRMYPQQRRSQQMLDTAATPPNACATPASALVLQQGGIAFPIIDGSVLTQMLHS